MDIILDIKSINNKSLLGVGNIAVSDFYLDFEGVEAVNIIAPFDLKITGTEVNNAAVLDIKVNGVAYVINDTITKFDTITVTPNIITFAILNIDAI
jgi:hypothetical protein